MSRREQMLSEIGVKPLWRLRDAQQDEFRETPREVRLAAEPEAFVAPPVPRHANEAPAPVAPSHSVPSLPDAPKEAAPAQPIRAPADSPVMQMGWDALRKAVADCQNCGLCKARKQAVLGVGDEAADWLFVGEGPGAEEDERGEPFVGQAGKLLDAMLASIGLARGRNVYIANAVKCRPPGNRTPEAHEIAACHPFLERQIELIRPRLIVALGRPAAQTLLEREVKIGAARGQTFDRRGIPVIVTYHPAYLLRNLEDKAKAWQDLCFALDQMQERSGS